MIAEVPALRHKEEIGDYFGLKRACRAGVIKNLMICGKKSPIYALNTPGQLAFALAIWPGISRCHSDNTRVE